MSNPTDLRVENEVIARGYKFHSANTNITDSDAIAAESGNLAEIYTIDPETGDTESRYLFSISLATEVGLHELQMSAWRRATNFMFRFTHDRQNAGLFFELDDAFVVGTDARFVCWILDPKMCTKSINEALARGVLENGNRGETSVISPWWAALKSAAYAIRSLHRAGLVLERIDKHAFFCHEHSIVELRMGDLSGAFRFGLQANGKSTSSVGNSSLSPVTFVSSNWKEFQALATEILSKKFGNLHSTANHCVLLRHLAECFSKTDDRETSLDADAICRFFESVCAGEFGRSSAKKDVVACAYISKATSTEIARFLSERFDEIVQPHSQVFDPNSHSHRDLLRQALQKRVESAKTFRVSYKKQFEPPNMISVSLYADDLLLTLRCVDGSITKRGADKSGLVCYCAEIQNLSLFEDQAQGFEVGSFRILQKRNHAEDPSYMRALPFNWFNVRPEEKKAESLFADFLQMANLVDLYQDYADVFNVEFRKLDTPNGQAPRILVRQINQLSQANWDKFKAVATKGEWTTEHARWLIRQELEGYKQPPQTLYDFIGSICSNHPDDPSVMLSATATVKQTVENSQQNSAAGTWDKFKWVVETENWSTKEAGGWIPLRARVNNPELLSYENASIYLRSVDHHAQVSVALKRLKLFRDVSSHAYLLNSLFRPTHNVRQSGLYGATDDLHKHDIDDDKRSVLTDILETRPIYALQGPPGTGKTNLVAVLLICLLESEPGLRILVAAKDHSAVDNLRSRFKARSLNRDRLKDIIEIRLQGRKTRTDTSSEIEGDALSISEIAKSMLAKSLATTSSSDLTSTASEALGKWRVQAQSWLDIQEKDDQQWRQTAKATGWHGFIEQVKRSANVVFATANASELMDVERDGLFDWVILEEAGIAHAVDVMPPLMAGSRWLLLGDHQQIRPYRIRETQNAFVGEKRGLIVSALRAMISDPANAKMRDLRESDATISRQIDVKTEGAEWLLLFSTLFQSLSAHQLTVTSGDARSRSAGMLGTQYRMHPELATKLISYSFYEKADSDRKLSTLLTAGERQHKFVNRSLRKSDGSTVSLIWLDVPFANLTKGLSDKRSVTEGRTSYENIAEAEAIRKFLSNLKVNDAGWTASLFLMSPYRGQCNLLERNVIGKLKSENLESLNWIANFDLAKLGASGIARTVTSTMGDECDIAILSLVRTMEPARYDAEKARLISQFIAEPGPLNVSLSRAKLLQVVCGDWEFFNNVVANASDSSESDPMYHLRRVIDSITGMIAAGEAKLILDPQDVYEN